jgi:hypothetical protein
VSLTISTRGHKASSEEAFIITVTGRTITSLMEVFGATTDTFISRVFKKTIQLLGNKADGVLHGNCLEHWVHLFPQFDNVHIVSFLDCKVDETCTPGTGPFNDEQLAPRQPGAEFIQRVMNSGHLK